MNHIQGIPLIAGEYKKLVLDIKNQFDRIPISGATISYPGKYPVFLSRHYPNLRQGVRRVGVTLTNPDGDNVRIGVAFHDFDGYKEDILLVSIDKILLLHRGIIEKIDIRYLDTHHSDKAYLEINTGGAIVTS